MNANLTNQGLKGQTTHALGWSIFSQFLIQGASFVVGVLFARLLSPQDFGLLAMISVFTGFISILGKGGMTQALVYRNEVSNEQINTAFSLSCISGGAIFVIGSLSSPFISLFFREPQIKLIMVFISLNIFISSISRVPVSLLQRSMNFKAIGSIRTASILVGGAVGVTLAYLGFGVWSLVAHQTTSVFFETFLYSYFAKWKPSFHWDKDALSDLSRYSSFLTLSQIVSYWTRNSDNFLIAKFLGSAPLGFYSRAYNLMLIPVTQITDVIGRVMWIPLARLQEDKKRVKEVVLKSLGVVSFIVSPMMILAIIAAPELFILIYGEKWNDAILPFQILCLVGLMQSLTSIGIWIYQSQGKTNILFYVQLCKGIAAIVGFLIGILQGNINSVAFAYLIVSSVFFYFELSIPGKIIGITYKEIANVILPNFIMATIMCVIVLIVSSLASIASLLLVLVIKVLTGGVAYLLTGYIIKNKSAKDSLSLALDFYQALVRRRGDAIQ